MESLPLAALPADPVPGRPGEPKETLWGGPPAYRPLLPGDREALVKLYAEIDATLAGQAGACKGCGGCCRFEPNGIILFATTLELAWLVGETSANPRPMGGMPAGSVPQACDAPKDFDMPTPERRHATHAGEGSWQCPYQEGNRCTARTVRPLGCRTYYCDPDARGEGEAVCRWAISRLRQIAADADMAWYGPARECLASWAAAAR
jgi:Fe-S-cluster containining protein